MVSEIGQQRFTRAHAAGGPVVGLRDSGEHRPGHVPGARPTPPGPLPPKLAEPPEDRPVHVIRRSGGTAARTDAGRPVATGDEPGARCAPDIPATTEESR